jgi:hypothetical protein
MIEQQEGRDLQEMSEAYAEAQVRAEVAAWQCLVGIQELNRIEQETATAWSRGLRDIIDAIDKARAELGRTQ